MKDRYTKGHRAKGNYNCLYRIALRVMLSLYSFSLETRNTLMLRDEHIVGRFEGKEIGPK